MKGTDAQLDSWRKGENIGETAFAHAYVWITYPWFVAFLLGGFLVWFVIFPRQRRSLDLLSPGPFKIINLTRYLYVLSRKHHSCAHFSNVVVIVVVVLPLSFRKNILQLSSSPM